MTIEKDDLLLDDDRPGDVVQVGGTNDDGLSVDLSPPDPEDGDEIVDDRLSADQREDGESLDEKRERRRREKKELAQRRREYQQADTQALSHLTVTVRQLQDELAATRGKIVQQEAKELDNLANAWVRRAKEAEKLKAKAIAEGDGEGFQRAEGLYAEAYRNAVYFDDLRKKPVQMPEPAQAPVSDTFRANVAAFLENNPWYNPDEDNPTTRVVRRLDAQVEADGYNPETPAYWQELEKRIARELPADVTGAQPRDTEGRFARTAPPAQRQAPAQAPRGGPPVAGRTNEPMPGQGNAVRVPPHIKTMMEESGTWDDPKVRARVLRNYQAKGVI